MQKIDKSLTGSAGVHFVVAELSRMGYIALPTVRNTKGIDVIITNPDFSKTIVIQVKTCQKPRKRPHWLLNEKADKIKSRNFFYVLVDIMKNNPDYYIVPSKIVADYVRTTHKMHVRKVKRNSGKKRTMRKIPNKYKSIDLEKYKKWEILRLDRFGKA